MFYCRVPLFPSPLLSVHDAVVIYDIYRRMFGLLAVLKLARQYYAWLTKTSSDTRGCAVVNASGFLVTVSGCHSLKFLGIPTGIYP